MFRWRVYFFIVFVNTFQERYTPFQVLCKVSTGGVSGTVGDPKLIFGAALKASASSILLSHNHPSGNLNPSQKDILLTRKIKEAGRFLELPVVDHLIVTSEGYYSFADQGLL